MTNSFKLSRRIARLRALAATVLVVAIAGCDDADSFNPDSSATPNSTDQGTTLDGSMVPAETPDAPAEAPPVASAAFSGGIPIGHFAQPATQFGSLYNGAQRNIYPQYLLRELAAIKARGGKVMVKLSFGDRFVKDASGHFDLNKWKTRVAMYKGINFTSYINDGTIIGHYLLDEPQDPVNWRGRPIPPATIEEMAKFSKTLWPTMPTIIRTWPDYLDSYSGSFRYLDAAWAQYAANRWPDAEAFVEENVAKARAKGLALVVGLNTLKGSPSKGPMSPSHVKTYGSGLLSSTYPCAFVSWKYDDRYLSGGSMKEAMSYLRNKAESRSFKTCRGS